MQLSDDEWRKQLSPEAFRVTRKGDTEPPFSGEHYRRTTEGDYLCVCCGALLFHADTKFDSGCGWPSFWEQAVPDSIKRLTDRSLNIERTEVRCANCDAHLGHAAQTIAVIHQITNTHIHRR